MGRPRSCTEAVQVGMLLCGDEGSESSLRTPGFLPSAPLLPLAQSPQMSVLTLTQTQRSAAERGLYLSVHSHPLSLLSTPQQPHLSFSPPPAPPSRRGTLPSALSWQILKISQSEAVQSWWWLGVAWRSYRVDPKPGDKWFLPALWVWGR